VCQRVRRQRSVPVGPDAKILTDFPIIRCRDQEFRISKFKKYIVQSREWLSRIAHVENIHLRTQFNGREKSLGPRHIRVDGWDGSNRTIYQFYSCLFHKHPNCPITKNMTVSFVPKKTVDGAPPKHAKHRRVADRDCKCSRSDDVEIRMAS
jgi:hypothetical protein